MKRKRKTVVEAENLPVVIPEGFIAHLKLGLDGRPIERTPRTDHYSFDAHYHYFRASDRPRTTIHSDRIAQQHYGKLTEARARFPKCWSMETFDLEQAAGALSSIFDREIRIIAVIQTCNLSTGYPIWAFEVEDNPA